MGYTYSNQLWLDILPPSILENTGWEVVVIDSSSLGGPDLVAAKIFRFSALTGSKMINELGSGSITINKEDPIFTEPLPAPLTGKLVDREYIWQIFKDGLLRLEWVGQRVSEDVATQNNTRLVTISGPSSEICLNWGIELPAWAERQFIVIPLEASSGTFKLKYGSTLTSTIAYNISASDLKTKIVSEIADIDSEDIEVTRFVYPPGETQTGWGYSFKFVGKFLIGNVFAKGFSINSNVVKNSGGDIVPLEISEVTSENDNLETTKRYPAIVLRELLERIQSRGILTFLTLTFDDVQDSRGEEWTTKSVTEIQPGETFLQVVKRLSEAFGWEFRLLPGFRLEITQGVFGTHREDEIIFWQGAHQRDHKIERLTTELVTDVWSQGSDYYITKASETSLASSARREIWVDGGSGSAEYAQRVANQTLAAFKNQLTSRTVTIPYGLDGLELFIDFSYGDWVAVEDDYYVQHVERIEAVSWSVNENSEVDMEVTFYGN